MKPFPFPRVHEFNSDIVITESIDGTSASVTIAHIPECGPPIEALAVRGGQMMLAASRTRYLSREEDNYGFAQWVFDNNEQLWSLGKGTHRGVWWGCGIGRGYGLADRRFYLINVARWRGHTDRQGALGLDGYGDVFDSTFPHHLFGTELPPACCGVVPVLGTANEFSSEALDRVLSGMYEVGSVAVEGYMNPEGVILYHVASSTMFRVPARAVPTVNEKPEPKAWASQPMSLPDLMKFLGQLRASQG